ALAQQERAGELDLEHAMPDPLVELSDGHAVVAARIGGVVHEYVDAPKGSHDAIDEILDCRGTTHVADPGQRAAPALADLLRGALDVLPAGLLLVVRIRRGIAPRSRHHHVGAFTRERDRGRPADPAQSTGSGDDRDPSVQMSHACTLLVFASGAATLLGLRASGNAHLTGRDFGRRLRRDERELSLHDSGGERWRDRSRGRWR